MRVEHLSNSQISMALRCGEQYRQRYVLGIIKPPSVALVQGSACHKAREHVMVTRLASGKLCPVDEATEAASMSLKTAWEKGVVLDGEYKEMGNDAARGAAEDQAVTLAEMDYDAHLIDTVPVAVEEKIEVENGALPMKLTGIIDLRDNTGAIRDLKTVARTPNQDDCDTNMQLTMYSLLHRMAHGEVETKLQLDCLVKTKTPKTVQLTTHREQSDIQVLLNRIARVWEMLEKEVFLPAPADSWQCSPKWCGFADTCPYCAGKKRVET